ncbi:MAG: hypothetical protein KDD67_02325 [Ignavibacteriae bacterium]|nr:hypothetical protein [Ignavibacteriota bacterium]MCB9216875.1 hypothetical protein [Ignavibacteria bacterium]
MIPGTVGKRKKRRLSVEVYFVLYLSAIILLLGTSPSDKIYDAQLESAIAELIDTDFEIDVQKIALIVPFTPAGMELDSISRLLPRDTMNIIRAHGNFSSVEFRIVAIEDTSTGSSLPSERAYLARETDSSVTFHWRQQDESQTAVYQVTIEAEAVPTLPENLSSPDVRQRIEKVIQERGLMRDTAEFTINVIPANSAEYLMAIRSAPTLAGNEIVVDSGVSTLDQLLAALAASNTSGSGFVATAPTNDVMVAPGGTWKQRIGVLGVAETSQLKVSGASGVRITSSGRNYIEIAGPAPTSGRENDVSVSINGPNGESSIVRFTVKVSQLNDPSVPSEMYTDETYNLDFTSDGIDPTKISVVISENGRRQESKPARFRFIPSTTSGQIIFSRYVDGEVYDQIKATVKPLPKPRIHLYSKDDYAVVEVTAYGSVNGQPNRPVLQVLNGNASEPEEGKTTSDPDNHLTKKVWIVRPKSSSEKFRFKVRAWDLRGYEYKDEQEYGE